MLLKTLIVDDEPIARQIMREELEPLESITLIGEADSGTAALEMIRAHRPDLVFLDLQMPESGGFDVIQMLPGSGVIPVVVIVTAFDEYAIRAFEAGALDYLLKPVSHERVLQAVERALRLAINRSQAEQQLKQLNELTLMEPAGTLRKVVARAGDEYVLLKTDEVLAFQAEGDLVWIVTAAKKYLATQTLRSLQQKLQNTSFRRVHRNALVNLDHVRKLSTLTSQRWLLTLNNSLEFIVSKRQARTVRDLLRW
jgi:two-component system LytT family response regulator